MFTRKARVCFFASIVYGSVWVDVFSWNTRICGNMHTGKSAARCSRCRRNNTHTWEYWEVFTLDGAGVGFCIVYSIATHTPAYLSCAAPASEECRMRNVKCFGKHLKASADERRLTSIYVCLCFAKCANPPKFVFHINIYQYSNVYTFCVRATHVSSTQPHS